MSNLIKYQKNVKALLLLFFFFLIASCAIPATSVVIGSIIPVHDDPLRDQVKYVDSHTAKDDYVLVWGAESDINFRANRKFPTRFVYQYPLYTKGYQNTEMIREFLQDIIKNKPALIIDTSSTNELIPPINLTRRITSKQPVTWSPESNYELPTDTNMVFKYIDSNYEYTETIGNGWISIDILISLQSQVKAHKKGYSIPVNMS